MLVTLDVTSLYTNIPHEDGIEACKYFLNQDKSISRLSPDEICSLIKLTLENNHFQFNDKNYIQKLGTAMGSSMAPAYASLFMGKLEKDFIEQCSLTPTVWLRFLDDIFMIWDHSLAELEDFINRLNSFHPTIKFTHTVSNTSVSFLDVNISKNVDSTLSTDIHIKSTDVHQYLHFSSCHPRKCKESIPYSQAKRFRRIISDDNSFQGSLDELKGHFLKRQYPEKVIDSAFQKISSQTQDEALVNSDVKDKAKNIIPFVVPYNTSLPNLGLTINKYWDLFNLSSKESLNFLHNHTPVIAFKRAKNLQDCLTHSILNKPNESSQSTKCNRRRCTHCSSIIESTHFTSTNTNETFNLHFSSDCRSKDVIYMITCKKCKKQYIGQTHQLVSNRMNSHKFDIRNMSDPSFSTNVAIHFNSNGHSIEDFSFMPIDYVSNNMNRLLKETYWIHKLDTLYPKSLNAKVLYKI